MSPQIAPYGSWKSPISAQDVYARFVDLGSIQQDRDDLYWCEFRPDGRTVIVRLPPGQEIMDVTPVNYDVRTRVHEYGGGDYLLAEGVLYFSNFTDQRMYRQVPGEEPLLFTHLEGMRYADGTLDAKHGRIIAVREDHTNPASQAVNTLIGIDLASGDEQVLVSGNDFYSTPRLNLDGTRLAWLTWNHPNMPWDGTELWVAEVSADGALAKPTLIAGGVNESIFQPQWSPDGGLYFVSDRTEWWNIYRWNERQGEVEALHPMPAEFGLPQWSFGMSMYGFASDRKLICIYTQNGTDHLASVDTHTLEWQEFNLPYTSIGELYVTPTYAFFIAGSSTQPTMLVQLEISNGKISVLRSTRAITIDPEHFSTAQTLEFPTEGGLTAYGFYYPPHNRDFIGPSRELPPLIVMSHGGPTAATGTTLRYSIQYWTTRGFAVLDVNYSGSTGYGRPYRERLNRQWGILDVADCVNGARYLASQGLVDGNRLAIRGGSAGGYVTLCAITFHQQFEAAASYFGISDLEALAKETHKFESRYFDGLIGPYPERRDLYLARSPIHHIENITCPLILFQGLDDPVVPPNQSQMIYEALRSRGLPVAMLTFPGEQHGFIKAENNIRAQEAELFFYSQIFKFELAEAVEPVEISNL